MWFTGQELGSLGRLQSPDYEEWEGGLCLGESVAHLAGVSFVHTASASAWHLSTQTTFRTCLQEFGLYTLISTSWQSKLKNPLALSGGCQECSHKSAPPVQLQTSCLGLHNHTGAFAFNLFAPEASIQSCCPTWNQCFSNRSGKRRAGIAVGGSASLATVDGTGPGLPFWS